LYGLKITRAGNDFDMSSFVDMVHGQKVLFGTGRVKEKNKSSEKDNTFQRKKTCSVREILARIIMKLSI